MKTSRRDFLKTSGFASAAILMPRFLQGLSPLSFRNPDRKLVIIQQSGGNDGLNAYVPFRNDAYYSARPQLAVKSQDVLRLNDEMGLNPAMSALREIYDQGWMSMVNSVGYPNPDRSHFRSMDIWHAGSGSDEHWDTGWLGRYLDHACSGASRPHQVVEIDDTLSLAVKGRETKGLAVRNPKQLYQSTQGEWMQNLQQHAPQPGHSELDYLYKTLTETTSSAAYLYERSQVYTSKISYPVSSLGRQLKMVAELICSGVETSVFYVSMTGFDTHIRQRGQHDRLLKQYSEAVAAFVKDLSKQGRLSDTAVLTFSEFGRRVKENASGGTDHGKANTLSLIGGSLKTPGVFNAAPDLSRLDDGDVSYEVDFRQVYATLLHDWLGVDDTLILKRSFDRLQLV